LGEQPSLRPRVLVADDEAVIRELLRRRLGNDGLEVETAADGDEAIARIRARFVNVLITDLQMPGVDGVELLRRTREESPDTVVIVMTAFAWMKSASDAVKLGAHDYLQKPFDHVDTVAQKVRLALGHQSLALENRALARRVEAALARSTALRAAGGAAGEAAEEIARILRG
jgi:two-component system response regulator AtoC